jgi:DNA-binding CsgD family transcriptional regulator
VEDASRALAKVPARAPIADVFEAIRPCVPVAAGLLGILRPGAPASMVTCPMGLDPPVLDSWLAMPEEHRAATLGPIFSSRPGDLWRDSQTVSTPLREKLEVFRKLDAAGLGEGAGYKVDERMSPLHGVEHIMLAMLMERGVLVPPRAADLLAALHPAISAAILRSRLPFLPGQPLYAQIVAKSDAGYVCVSHGGSVIEANSRAHELVTRFRDTLRIPGGRGVVTGFAERAPELASRSRTWRREGDGPRSILQARTIALAKEIYDLHEDIFLVVLEEIDLPESRADEVIGQVELTPTEKKIAYLLAHTPLSSKEIAAKFSSKTRTIETHANRIYRKLRKLGARGRQELLWLAAR